MCLLVPGAARASVQAHDCLPAGLTREDLVNLLDGPWQRLRAVLEKKVIDFHTHNWQFQDTGLTFSERAAIIARREAVDFTEPHLRDMRIHGIDRAVVIPPRIATWVSHEQYLQSISRHPSRLLEVADVDRNLKMSPKEQVEFIRGRLKAGARIMSVPGIGQPAVDLDKIRPFMELAEELDVPVEGDVLSQGRVWTIRDPQPWIPVLEAFPKVKFTVADSGGAKGFMTPGGHLGIQMAGYFDNLYFVTDSAPIAFIEMAVKAVGAHRILFGTDIGYPGIREYLPRGLRAASQRWRNLNAVALAEITEDQRDMILYRNARKMLKLDS